jgi:hypothetical protein
MRRAVLTVAAFSAVLLSTPCTSAFARTEVTRATGVDDVYALGGTVLYHRAGSWMRIVAGRASPARDVPRDAVASSIGRDRRGRVVVTFTRWPKGDGVRFPRWWVYDVERDLASALELPTSRRCFARSVALWREGAAYGEQCWRQAPGSRAWSTGPRSDIVYIAGRRVRRVRVEGAPERLVLRGRSLAAVASDGESASLLRIADRGRWCAATLEIVDLASKLGPIAIRRGSVAWATHDLPSFPDARYPRLLITDVALTGRCEKSPPKRFLSDDEIPDGGAQAATITEEDLYYATRRAVYMEPLTASGSVAPPVNDDFERATPIGGELPVSVRGRTGYATPEPGETIFEDSSRTVWYAFLAPQTETVYLQLDGYGWMYGVFDGPSVSRLSPLLNWNNGTGGECAYALGVQAGQTSFISVAASGDPWFDAFSIRISRNLNDDPRRDGDRDLCSRQRAS